MGSMTWMFLICVFLEMGVLSSTTNVCKPLIFDHNPVFDNLRSVVKQEGSVSQIHECAALCNNGEPTYDFSYNEDTEHCTCGYIDLNSVIVAPNYKFYSSANTYAAWTDSVIAKSSEYDDPRYAAWQILGEPDVYPDYGDIERAWSHVIGDQDIWIEVKTSCLLLVTELHVYETLNPGNLKTIALRDMANAWADVWTSASPQSIGGSRIFKPDFTPLTSPTDGVRLSAYTLAGTYVQYDAILVVGEVSKYRVGQWVNAVINKSTEYSDTRFAAWKALGEPDVYPQYGDFDNAWTHAVADQDIWIELKTERFLVVEAVHVYETLNSGQLKRIALREPGLTWTEVWSTSTSASVGHFSRIFVPDFTPLSVPTDGVRLEAFYINGNHVEIDAVYVIGSVSQSTFPVWADAVIDKSTEYGTTSFAAYQALGPPNVYPNYGDYDNAWTHVLGDPNIWIEVQTAHILLVQELHIYETYNSGSLKRIALRDATPTWNEVWTSTARDAIGSSRIFIPEFTPLAVPTDGVRLEAFSFGHYVEIDAISVIGFF